MSHWTCFGSGVWHWPRFTGLSMPARLLYLALYTSPHAKTFPVGLWTGGLSVMADAAAMGASDAIEALGELVTSRLVEVDTMEPRVARLVELPDRLERPNNGRALRHWWNAFKVVPDCAVRSAHVATLRWVLGTMSSDHETVWNETFATVAISPLPEPLGAVVEPQASLPFDTRNAYGMPYGIVNIGTANPSPEIATLGYQRGKGKGKGSDLVLGSQPELDSTTASEPVDKSVGKDPLPFTVGDLVKTLADRSAGRFSSGFDARLAGSLTTAIRAVAASAWGLPEVALLGDWLAAGGLGFRSDLGARWATQTGALVESIAQAVAWDGAGRPAMKSSSGARATAPGRVEPTTTPVFRAGRRPL